MNDMVDRQIAEAAARYTAKYAEIAREDARRLDGKFGTQHHSDPEGALAEEKRDRGLWDCADLTPITCELRDKLLHDRADLTVFSSVTDHTGEYGSPLVYTEWGKDDRAVLRDYRYPNPQGGDDTKRCEHYVFPGGSEAR